MHIHTPGGHTSAATQRNATQQHKNTTKFIFASTNTHHAGSNIIIWHMTAHNTTSTSERGFRQRLVVG
jgi:hypothetical protein